MELVVTRRRGVQQRTFRLEGILLRFAFACLVAIMFRSPALAQGEAQADRGRVLVDRFCSECHSVGVAGQSPHPAAPTFRRLRRVLDFDSLVGRLREGILVAHPDMPAFRFTREEARAIAAYLLALPADADTQ
jgi:mono/diheme cytochrome c family protein